MVHIKINGLDFETYNDDTVESIKERVAAKLNTLPQYLYFPNGKPTKMTDFQKESTLVEDLKAALAKNGADIKKTCEGSELDVETCLSLYLAFNEQYRKTLHENPGYVNFMLLDLRTQVNIDKGIVEEVWEGADETRRAILQSIDANKEQAAQKAKFRDTKPLPMTNFVVEKMRCEVTLGLSHPHGLLEVFDRVVLNPEVPFAGTGEFYKILKDSVPLAGWTNKVEENKTSHVVCREREPECCGGCSRLDHKITIRMDATETLDREEYISVSACLLGADGKCTTELASQMRVSMALRPAETDVEMVTNRIKGVLALQDDEGIGDRKETNLSGVFYICLDGVRLNRDIFADLLMNDAEFRANLSTDESEKATKIAPTTHIQFGVKNDPLYVTANITPDIANKTTVSSMKKKGFSQVFASSPEECFGANKHFLRVNVKYAADMQSIDNFRHQFGRLMRLYVERAPTILKEYRRWLGADFGIPDKESAPLDETHTMMRQLIPEIAGKNTGYARSCQSPFQPTVLQTEKEINQAEEQGYQVMYYPKDSDISREFPQRVYACLKNSDQRFPGLKLSRLKKGSKYFPCCYASDQRVQKESGDMNSVYRDYLDGVISHRGKGQQQQLASRQNFMDPLQTQEFAEIPIEVQTLLDSLVFAEGWRFVRNGVFDSKSSFLDCVITALGLYDQSNKRVSEVAVYKSALVVATTDELKRAEDSNRKKEFVAKLLKKKLEAERSERLEVVGNLRAKLGKNPAYVASCRQEMYDFTGEEISEWLESSETYLDPKLFTNLLETYFGCNIFVFSRVEEYDLQRKMYEKASETQLVLPRHLQAYYNTPKSGPCVLIYEHMGNEADKAEYPRCEIIAHWNVKANTTDWAFGANGEVGKSVRGVYEVLRKSYALNTPIPEAIFPFSALQKLLSFRSQAIDVYGKCRRLNFQYGELEGTLITAPLQPFPLPATTDWTIHRLSRGQATQLMKDITSSSSLTEVQLRGGQGKAYSAKVGNIQVLVPLQNDHIKDVNSSVLKSYIRYSKLARYLVEYARWLYSQYIDDEGVEISTDSIVSFTKAKTEVVPEFEYGQVPKYFSDQSGVMNNGKLILKSQEALKRLLFTLRMYSKRYQRQLTGYKDRVSIENYYTEPSDFLAHRFQIVLQGSDSVDKWIEESNQERLLYSAVPVAASSRPYFLKNAKIGRQVLLAQMVVTAERALDLQYAVEVSRTWAKDDFNDYDAVKEKDQEEELGKFTLYSYENRDTVTAYACDNKDCQDSTGVNESKVLGYKDNEGNSIFTALLPV